MILDRNPKVKDHGPALPSADRPAPKKPPTKMLEVLYDWLAEHNSWKSIRYCRLIRYYKILMEVVVELDDWLGVVY